MAAQAEAEKTYINIDTLEEISAGDLQNARIIQKEKDEKRKKDTARKQIQKDYLGYRLMVAGAMAAAFLVSGITGTLYHPGQPSLPERLSPYSEKATVPVYVDYGEDAVPDYGEKLNLVNENGAMMEEYMKVETSQGVVVGALEDGEKNISVSAGSTEFDSYDYTLAGFIQIGTSWDEIVYQLGDCNAYDISFTASDEENKYASVQEISIKDFDTEYIQTGKVDLRSPVYLGIETVVGTDGKSYGTFTQLQNTYTAADHSDLIDITLVTPDAMPETSGQNLLVRSFSITVG
ncbi:MAG: hypothetical protein VZT48_05905 [Bulleidia sp.]|nr:hypothetical protein [Bulleidia sp.]